VVSTSPPLAAVVVVVVVESVDVGCVEAAGVIVVDAVAVVVVDEGVVVVVAVEDVVDCGTIDDEIRLAVGELVKQSSSRIANYEQQKQESRNMKTNNVLCDDESNVTCRITRDLNRCETNIIRDSDTPNCACAQQSIVRTWLRNCASSA
jgi:hypothetical protein